MNFIACANFEQAWQKIASHSGQSMVASAVSQLLHMGGGNGDEFEASEPNIIAPARTYNNTTINIQNGFQLISFGSLIIKGKSNV